MLIIKSKKTFVYIIEAHTSSFEHKNQKQKEKQNIHDNKLNIKKLSRSINIL